MSYESDLKAYQAQGLTSIQCLELWAKRNPNDLFSKHITDLLRELQDLQEFKKRTLFCLGSHVLALKTTCDRAGEDISAVLQQGTEDFLNRPVEELEKIIETLLSPPDEL